MNTFVDKTEAITVLQTNDLPPEAEQVLSHRFDLVRLPADSAAYERFLLEHGVRIRATAGTGKGPIERSLLAGLPNLELISVTSAGLDGIDCDEAARRGIPIFNTSSILAGDVADLALWLIIGTTRGLVHADHFVREGQWGTGAQYPLGRTIAGMRIGILGLGHIGKEIARRVTVLGAKVAYTGRTMQPDAAFQYFPDLLSLAEWCELLVVSCPSTPQTKAIIDAQVLHALGANGILVNISRGNVVDETALIAALSFGNLFAAGLDVFENEPNVPQALRDSHRVILLPHIGSATQLTRARMWQSMVDVLLGHFSLPPQHWATAG